MAPADTRPPQDIKAIALHEIGHAVVATRLNMTVDSVSIIPRGGTGGHTLTQRVSTIPTWPQLTDMVAMTLGGRAADLILGEGANAGAEVDLAVATDMLLRAYEAFGLRGTLASRQVIKNNLRPKALVDAVEADLQHALSKATAIIMADEKAVVTLAERLMHKRVMSGRDIAEVLEVAVLPNAQLTSPQEPSAPLAQDDPVGRWEGMLPYGN